MAKSLRGFVLGILTVAVITGCPSTLVLTVNVSPAESGAVSLNPPGGSYALGATVTLNAVPNAGFVFDHWEGNVRDTSQPNTSLVMNSAEDVVAHFVEGGSGDEGESATDEGEGPADGEEPGEIPDFEMVRIDSGTFQMGRYPGEQDSYPEEDPQHQVTMSSGFWLGKYQVTKGQWEAVMGTTPWSGQIGVLDDPDSPATYVSWNDAQDFVEALNDLSGETYRLPSEAEWEYACRAGTETRFYWGDDPNYTAIDDYAWWYGSAEDAGEGYAHVVGEKLENAWGLHDMSGNVLEWCEDDWHANYTGAPSNGSAWVDSPRGSNRVRRGGSWHDADYYCRSAYRHSNNPSYASNNFGFRLAR